MNNLRILFTLLLFAFEAYTKPAISVIVPVYKTERFLQECLDSILNQSMKDIEVICINDASPDDCAKILAEYAKKDSRIVVINFSQNRGPSAARNAGLDSAQGDYIAFCDSDDYMHPDMLQILYREIKKEDFDIAYCHTNHVGESTIQHFEKIPSYVIEKYTTIQEPDKQTISNNYFSVLWCKLYKKTTIGSSKFDEELFCFEDISFNLSLLGSLKKYVLVPAKLYYWRQSNNSITSGSYTHKHINSVRRCIEKIQKLEIIPEQKRLRICCAQLYKMLRTITKYGAQGNSELWAVLDVLNAAYKKNIIPYGRLKLECLKVHVVIEHYLQKLYQLVLWKH